MVKKLPVIALLCYAFSINAQSEQSKTSWFTSNDTKGYISIQQESKDNEIILNTAVKAKFENEILNFNLSTTNSDPKLLSPTKFQFKGTIAAEIRPVNFTGTLIKTDKRKVAYWNFDGDFVDEMETDPDVKRFAFAKYNATLKIPERTIPSFNLWAIIPNLKFDRKGTFIFNSLDETKLYVKRNQTVNYLGTDKILVNGETVKSHKFVHQGKGMLKSYFWVSPDKQLLQVFLDNKYTFTLSTREKAMQSAISNTASVDIDE